MRHSIQGLVALVVVALAGLAGCMKTDPLFCCTTSQSCSAAGETEMFPCTDTSRPYCDDVGDYGVPRTCIADPLSNPCAGPEDCNTDRPFCVDNKCVECDVDGACGASAPVCEPTTNMCGACTGDPDCSTRTDTSRCNTDDGACVACLEPADCTDPAAPVCDTASHACRGCTADNECASNVCDQDSGACIDEADVIYLATTGSGSTCTLAAPCGTFTAGLNAVSGNRNVIKAAPGTYTGQLTIDGLTVTILADGVTVQPPAANQTVVAVTNGATATIEGVTVTGASGAANPAAVTCGGGTSSITLRRSSIVANGGGGVSISQCQFALVNNVIALNGGATSVFGGVSIGQVSTGSLHGFEFNSVTGNVGISGANTGVDCTQIGIPLGFANNIVYGNAVIGGGTQVGGDSDCSWTYSDVGPDTVAGTGNINGDPEFVNVPGHDFHIMSGSPAQDAADPAATVARDIDGDARPQGTRSDMGADEVLP